MKEQLKEQMRTIYMDYQASTPCDDKVIETMMPYLKHEYGNPHARSHTFGWRANEALDKAREQVAQALNAKDPTEIIFTSGATESNNLAVKGLAEFWKNSKRKHIISIPTEHKCLLEALKDLEAKGWDVEFLDVDENGLIDPAKIKAAIRSDTLMIALSAVNHEIGCIQPIEAIGKIARQHKLFFHVDAAQAMGKIPIDVTKCCIDTLSISAHKFYGPNGIGALYVSKSPQRVRLIPQNSGGGQERGMRSGTTAVFLAAGLGKACELFCNKEELAREFSRISELHETFWKSLSKHEHIYLNGPLFAVGKSSSSHTDSGLSMKDSKRIPHNLNISVAGVEGESLMMEMPNLAFSSGSACTSANLEPSYVLKSIGVTGPKEDLLHSSVRVSFGRDTTKQEIEQICKQFDDAILKLREISPVWYDLKQGNHSYD